MAAIKPRKTAKKAVRPGKPVRTASMAKPTRKAGTKAKPRTTKVRKPATLPGKPMPDSTVQGGWTADDVPVSGWSPASQPSTPTPPVFDPATGAWLPVAPPAARSTDGSGPPVVSDAPEATRKGTASYILWSILLWFDLALLTLQVVAVVVGGIVLITAPESDMAERFRQSLEIASPTQLLIGSLVSLLAFGIIPFAWVMGTRRDPIEGTKRFLYLHEPAKGIVRGVLLTIPLLVAVAILSSVYIVATQGVDALTNPAEDTNPAVEAILANLTWPLALVVALCAGIGEEIFFRGLLQRYIGTWGQAVLFGVAHAAGGYIPQIVFALGLGILFGFLLKRGWSLWSLITAHVLYDVVLLSIGLVSR